MDGIYNSRENAGANIAGLIRASHSGNCSGYPVGIEYPGVPSVADVLDELHLVYESSMTEQEWCAACEICGRKEA